MEDNELVQLLSDINKEAVRMFWDSTFAYFNENHFWLMLVIGLVICLVVIVNIKSSIETKNLLSEQNQLLEKLIKLSTTQNDNSKVDTSMIDNINNDLSLNNPEVLDTLLTKINKNK